MFEVSELRRDFDPSVNPRLLSRPHLGRWLHACGGILRRSAPAISSDFRIRLRLVRRPILPTRARAVGAEIARRGRQRCGHARAQEQLDGRSSRRAALRNLHDVRQRVVGGARRRRQSARRSDRHLRRRFQSRRSALPAPDRRRGHPGRRVRLFPHATENFQSRLQGQLHPAPAGFGNARARARRDSDHRGPARQKGQLWTGGQRLEPDRDHRVSAAWRAGRAGAL